MTDADGLGRLTRGRTAPGRLRLVDAWLWEREGALLRRRDGAWANAIVLDVGIGSDPSTALELRDSLESTGVPLVVVDVDEKRVAGGLTVGLDARVGSFASVVTDPTRLVRAINLLRAYGTSDIPAAHEALAAPLLEGGILLEGTTDATGAVATMWVLRRTRAGMRRERLVFLTDFSRGFGPGLFWDHLPRDLRREAAPGSPIRLFLDDWKRAWQNVRAAAVRDPSLAFDATAAALRGARSDVLQVGPGMLELDWPPRSAAQGLDVQPAG